MGAQPYVGLGYLVPRRISGQWKKHHPIFFQKNQIVGDIASINRLVNHLQLPWAIKYDWALKSLLPHSSRSKRRHDYIL